MKEINIIYDNEISVFIFILDISVIYKGLGNFVREIEEMITCVSPETQDLGHDRGTVS